ncbi:MAG: glycosyltransferase [Candidatus Omnitrophota bacterium]|nr:glycosyltransferase [Candidatus Omnitrophota bacterium]
MAKKILICYATAGIGHKKAALAVEAAFKELSPEGVEFSIIDSLDYTNPFFKWIYLKVYLLMVNKFPLLWGLLYYLTDNFYVNLIVAPMRRFNNWLNSGKLSKFLIEMKPDVVISTHFFGSEVIADMKRRGAMGSRLVSIVTDYRLHSWWVSGFVDTYIVAGEDAVEDLLKWKTPQSKIAALGIPAEPIFAKKLDKKNIREKTGLPENTFTLLVIGGGFGVGPIEEIIEAVGGMSIQIIAVCGHNEELVRKLEGLKPSLKAGLKVLGYVDNVYEYMEVSDLLISKSGGITVTEALTKELPMVVISPIIGQETRNCDFMTKHGAAIKVDKASDARRVVEEMIADPAKIGRMKDAIKKIKKPTACYDIVRLAIGEH